MPELASCLFTDSVCLPWKQQVAKYRQHFLKVCYPNVLHISFCHLQAFLDVAERIYLILPNVVFLYINCSRVRQRQIFLSKQSYFDEVPWNLEFRGQEQESQRILLCCNSYQAKGCMWPWVWHSISLLDLRQEAAERSLICPSIFTSWSDASVL